MVLHFIHNKNALDKLGWSYIVQAVAMAQELKLFTTYIKPRHEAWCTVQSITAWAMFPWQA